MTLITWNGGPIFRDGAVSTEQACCCDTPPPPPPDCDVTCLRWCEQSGTLIDPEQPCPDGYSKSFFGESDALCVKYTESDNCEDGCDEESLPAPESLQDYAVGCIGYCCNNKTVCNAVPCCECTENNCEIISNPIYDNSGLDQYGQGISRSGFTAGGPNSVQWARGYPDKYISCFFWWLSNVECTVVVQAGTPTTPTIYAGNGVQKWTLYGCQDGEYVDMTSTFTTNGPFISRYDTGGIGAESAYGGVPCPTEAPEDFLYPEFDCNPLP
jgi:hypothetical protein